MRSIRYALSAAALATVLCANLPAMGAAAKQAQPDCSQLQTLYNACHSLGLQSDSAQTCEEAGEELVIRALRNSASPAKSARTQAEQVCATGCEDALGGQPAATAQELAEAFCNQPPATKAPGGRP